ncbi:AraC family transcriptional regulator [Aquimarina sp. U1-2]|uniref:helix-turn-helix domain-containing protein n=1 Tax=Aquimarina sp. U1-2 TaxID=2823141 RepID=UPI001AECC14E|nr:helix-turn-helix domain-containing protein [Aquimarina sp. U1-2]MBP2830570.1 AraC family transcriptional regulator [Aquimarina sp. U1-2]
MSNDFAENIPNSFVSLTEQYQQNEDNIVVNEKSSNTPQIGANSTTCTFEKLSYSHMALVNPLLLKEYVKKINIWTTLCLCIGFMGCFIGIILTFRINTEKTTNRLIGVLVLSFSLLILHDYLIITNLQYSLPHTLYFSTAFTFLYGPLLYFYFKRITSQYRFVKQDLIHFLPVVLILLLLLPTYVLPEEKKLNMMQNNSLPYFEFISVARLLVLSFYGFLIIRVYRVNISRLYGIKGSKQNRWITSLVVFYLCYAALSLMLTILVLFALNSTSIQYIKTTAVTLFVLYVSYIAFVHPSILDQVRINRFNINKASLLLPVYTQSKVTHRYQNSGLTAGLSLELKERLLYLLNHEKIYRQNDLTLQKLSELLDTTRHNTSQVINEHFDLNFFDLINLYRIQEAKKLLRKRVHQNHSTIIDIVYEVGFNNKVTFYRSFKKHTKVTPTKYVKSNLE